MIRDAEGLSREIKGFGRYLVSPDALTNAPETGPAIAQPARFPKSWKRCGRSGRGRRPQRKYDAEECEEHKVVSEQPDAGRTPRTRLFFTTADGLAHAWYELGQPGAPGPAIVLQHGFSATTWHEWIAPGIAAALAGLRRRVIGLDARGHGRSTASHDPDHYGENRMAHDVVALADHLGLDRYDYLGYSMGGVIGLRLATIEPRLRRLIVAGIGEAAVLLGGVDRRVLDMAMLAAGLRATDVSGFPPMVRAFRSGVLSMGNDPLALAAHADRVASDPIALDTISAPTLLIAGDADPLAVNPGRLAAAIPNCRLVTVPGDHVAARLCPQFTQAVLGFLG